MTQQNETKRDLARIPASDTVTMRMLIEAKRPEIESLAMAGITAERLSRVTMLAISKSPDLQRCSAMSVLSAMMEASKLGLDCSGGTMAQGYLVPMAGQAVFMPGYRGLRELVLRSGMYDDIYAEVVYAADHFEVSLGTDPKIVHIPNIFCGRKDEDVIGAYSVAVIRGGRKHIDFIDLAYITKVQNFSKMGRSGAWRDWYSEQVRKTAMRHGCKGLSMSAEVRRAFEIEDDVIANVSTPSEPKPREPYKPSKVIGGIDLMSGEDRTHEQSAGDQTGEAQTGSRGVSTPPENPRPADPPDTADLKIDQEEISRDLGSRIGPRINVSHGQIGSPHVGAQISGQLRRPTQPVEYDPGIAEEKAAAHDPSSRHGAAVKESLAAGVEPLPQPGAGEAIPPAPASGDALPPIRGTYRDHAAFLSAYDSECMTAGISAADAATGLRRWTVRMGKAKNLDAVSNASRFDVLEAVRAGKWDTENGKVST